MHKAFIAVALLSLLALSGCSKKDEDHELTAVTCPDGSVLTPEMLEAMPDHHEAGFNATSHCPVKPSVTLMGIPANLQSFKTAAFSWVLDNGTVEHAHSMLTSIRYSERSVPDADLTNINKYPTELVKREHQNLPVTYVGNLSFAKVERVYVRAYMEVAGADFWSKEVAINITAVVPTGNVVEVTKAVGAAPTPDVVDIVLGDSVKVTNSNDPLTSECDWKSGPANTANFEVAMGSTSSTILYIAPGLYEYGCNEAVGATGFKVNVKLN